MPFPAVTLGLFTLPPSAAGFCCLLFHLRAVRVLTFILVCPQKGTKSATVNTGRRPSDSERGYRAAARRPLPCDPAFGDTRAIAAGSDASDPVGNELGDDRRVTHGEDARLTGKPSGAGKGRKIREKVEREVRKMLIYWTSRFVRRKLTVSRWGFFSCPVFSRSASLPVNAACYIFK